MDFSVAAGIIGTFAGLMVAILVPAFGWLLKTVINYGTRITTLERDQANLKEGVSKDIKDLKTGVKDLSDDLRKHMEDEPEQLKRALREVLHENHGPNNN